jgi:hypothetical protein
VRPLGYAQRSIRFNLHRIASVQGIGAVRAVMCRTDGKLGSDSQVWPGGEVLVFDCRLLDLAQDRDQWSAFANTVMKKLFF